MTTNEIRLDNAKNKLVKLQTKLDRVNVALSGGKNPYSYDEYDLRVVNREIKDTEETILKYEEKIKAEQSVERVEAVEIFLDDWEQKALNWYREDYRKLTDYITKRRIKQEIFRRWKQETFNYEYEDNAQTKAYEVEQEIDWDSYQKALGNFNKLTIKLKDYGKEWEKQLIKTVARDKVAKRKNLIERVKFVVGDITDASNLYVADNMEINGIISGKLGKAEVRTITAGGYNIQIFHYRVLVNKL